MLGYMCINKASGGNSGSFFDGLFAGMWGNAVVFLLEIFHNKKDWRDEIWKGKNKWM